MMTNLFIVFCFAMLRITKVISCRQPCRTVEPVRGYCLRDRYYLTYTSLTLERCISLCEQDTGCFSINYFQRSSVCQLNNSSKDDAPQDFVQDIACLYVANVLRLQHLPLEPGHRCKSSNDSKALGMRSREIIQNTQITGSKSVVDYEPYEGRLESSRAWMPETSNNPFIQVSFKDVRRILTAVASQGCPVHLCWVTKYAIEYQTEWNSLDWELYPKIFEGNKGMNTVVKNAISRPFLATKVRLRPQASFGRICMRIELYGCMGAS